jgi:hypothetical protein
MGLTAMESRLSLCYVFASSIGRVCVDCFLFVADDDDDDDDCDDGDRDGIFNVSVAINIHDVLGNWVASMEMPFRLGSL